MKPIRYRTDSQAWFQRISQLPHPVWLDSNASERGRYDILSAQPLEWMSADADTAGAEFFQRLRQSCEQKLNGELNTGLPFNGGVIGLLSYDFGLQLQAISSNKASDVRMPLAEAGLYAWAVIQDHQLKKSTFVSQLPRVESLALLRQLQAEAEQPLASFSLSEALSANLDREQYENAFEQIQEYILDGDCYQINYSKRYSAAYQGAPQELFQRLRAVTSAPFSAYFAGQNSVCLSMSPERFVQVDGRDVLTQPIKGTAPRSEDTGEDQRAASALSNSEKNRAENLMIVDLLRNDFGKVCTPGSIAVPELFELQSFASVHHLVSTITGTLAADQDALHLLEAVFPGGSITGAPKHRAMQIIDELEPTRRSVYCGSVFYYSADGRLDSNILIRSLLCTDDGHVYCWGGGGVVLDSTAQSEWQEIDDKIGRLLSVAEAK